MARTYTYLFGIGATVALATLLLPGDADRSDVAIASAATAAYIAAATCLVGFDRLPEWFFRALPPIGTVMATVVVIGGGPDVATVYAFFYFWSVFAAFSFLSLRAGIANVALVAVAFAGALEWLDADFAAVRWVMTIAAVAVAGILTAVLRQRLFGAVDTLTRRVSQQESIARIGRRALATADLLELFEWTAAELARVLGAERAAVLGLPDGKSLMYRAGYGWEQDAARSAVIPLDDPLAGPALLADGPIVYNGDVSPLAGLAAEPPPSGAAHTGIASAIRGPEDILGVVLACGTDSAGFSADDARFVQAVSNVLAEAARRHDIEEESRRKVIYDPVTDRPNRILFMDRLGEAVLRADRTKTTLAVFIVEIDDFKIINDSYGDLFGDSLLRAFASRLRKPLYLADTVARMGGPEFAVLCEDLDADRAAVEVAQNLAAAVVEPFDIGGEHIRVRACMGVATSDRTTGPKDVVTRADAALYKCRERGGGGVRAVRRWPRAATPAQGLAGTGRLGSPGPRRALASRSNRSSRSATAARRPVSACFAGSIRSGARSHLVNSSRWPRRPARSSASAPGWSTKPRGWRRRCERDSATRLICRCT